MLNRCAILFLLAFARVAFAADPADEYAHTIRPIFEKYCFECHGEKKHKGDLNLQSFDSLDKVKVAADTFDTVAEKLRAYEMPPKKKQQPDFDEHKKLVAWLEGLPHAQTSEQDCDQIGSDRSMRFYRGYVMSRRLNRAEYINTIRDLFGVPIDLKELLPSDGGGGEGFDTSGSTLFISSIHIEKYLAAADLILKTVLPDEEADREEIAHARTQILGPKGIPDKSAARATAREVVARIARLAFRRPPKTSEIDHLMTMFDRAWQRGDGYIPALRLALKAVLISPNFLFLAEPEPEQKGVQPLEPFALASKLSYFLWSSMPDEELLSAAQTGKLNDPNLLREEVRRMLASPKARSLGERFAIQWLDLDRLGGDVKPDPEKFPEFTDQLRDAMLQQVITQFNYLIEGDHSLLELIDADYAFLNEPLAKIYRVPNVKGEEMRKVQLTDRKRGGLLGMPAIAAVTSYPTRTSPVLRGKWILEALLGQKVNPPPPGVPPLEASASKDKVLTLRQQLALHRANPECASCHVKMDPLGLSMENFDVLGRWRDQDHGLPIDASGKLPSGETFTGPDGLKKVLLARKDAVMRHLARKMTGYAFGRELNKFDQCVIKKEMQALEENDYRPSALIEQIVISFPFRHRFYPRVVAEASAAGE